MRRSLTLCLSLVLAATAAHAESKNPADYPLRFHIFNNLHETNFYRNRTNDESKGEGRGNLFEGGEPHGVDFTFDCSEKLKPSFGYESYAAKWKKPGKEITVLLPVFGKTGSFFTYSLKTDVKDFAYLQHDGRMGSEPVANFKAWMIKHDYDPEHGKNEPTK